MYTDDTTLILSAQDYNNSVGIKPFIGLNQAIEYFGKLNLALDSRGKIIYCSQQRIQ